MRISDWSSDVCSSDLTPARLLAEAGAPDNHLGSPPGGDGAPALSVSQLSAAIKRTVEGGFARVRVRGELSGAKRAASGHFYAGLKDANALIDIAMWKGQASRLAFRHEDGIEVSATGRVTTSPGRGQYHARKRVGSDRSVHVQVDIGVRYTIIK